MKKQGLLLFLCLLLVSSGADAGWIIKEKTDSDFGGSETSTSMFQGGKVKISDPAQIVIFDSASGSLVIILKDRNVHWKGSLQELLSRSTETMSNGMEGDGEFGEAEWEGPGNSDGGGMGIDGGFQIKKTSSTESIAGIRAVRTDVLIEGMKIGEIWIGEEIELGKEIDLDMYGKLQTALGDMVWGFCEMEPSVAQVLRSGYLLKAVFRLEEGMSMSKTVIELKKADIPASAFNIPSGTREISLSEMIGQQEMAGEDDWESRDEMGGQGNEGVGTDENENYEDWGDEIGNSRGEEEEYKENEEATGNAGYIAPKEQGSNAVTEEHGSLSTSNQALEGSFTSIYQVFSLNYPKDWELRQIEGDNDYTIFVIQRPPAYDISVFINFDFFISTREFIRIIDQSMDILKSGRKVGGMVSVSCCSGDPQIKGMYQDYEGDNTGVGPVKARCYYAPYDHVSICLTALTKASVFDEVEPILNSIYKSIRITPVNRAGMQQLAGTWQGVPIRTSGYNAGVSTEHLMTFYPDGSCSSNDFVAVSATTDGTSPMAGYDEHRVSGIASRSFQGQGRFFVVGNLLMVVEPDGSHYAYDCSENGVLMGKALKYIRN